MSGWLRIGPIDVVCYYLGYRLYLKHVEPYRTIGWIDRLARSKLFVRGDLRLPKTLDIFSGRAADVEASLRGRAEREAEVGKTKLWVKIQPWYGRGWSWFMRDEETGELINLAGGTFGKSHRDMVLEEAQASQPDDLDWHGSFLEQNNVYDDYGWLSPEGKFYLCNDQCHALYARLLLKSEEEILERLGWIKTHGKTAVVPWTLSDLCRRHEPTQGQTDWLFDHGYPVR